MSKEKKKKTLDKLIFAPDWGNVLFNLCISFDFAFGDLMDGVRGIHRISLAGLNSVGGEKSDNTVSHAAIG